MFSVEPASSQTAYYQKKNVGDDQNKWVKYASEISNNSLDFIMTLESENSLWTADRVGVTGDKGHCQVSPYWHPEITNHPNFYDSEWQLQTCWGLFKGGTKFYGYERLKNDSSFRDMIYNRFYLTYD